MFPYTAFVIASIYQCAARLTILSCHLEPVFAELTSNATQQVPSRSSLASYSKTQLCCLIGMN